MFITADGKLRRAVSIIRNGELADTLVSGIAMVKLIDLLLGVKVDHRGLARLIWGVHAMDVGGAMRRYFTDLGLKKQGDVETMVLPKVVERTVREAESTPEFSGLGAASDNPAERKTLVDFLDRFEDRFYEFLEAAVADRAKQMEKEPIKESEKTGERKKTGNRRRGRRGR